MVLGLQLLAHLAALETTVLRLALHAELLVLLALECERMPTAMLTGHGEALHLRRREAAAMAVTMAATAAAAEGLELRRCEAASAAMTMAVSAAAAAAIESLEVRIASASAVATTVAAALLDERRRAASAAAMGSATAIAVAVAASGLCRSRAGNRQRSDARGEEQPGHGISPFERKKRPVSRTVPTSKRMEPAV
jgi:hypothetical protein